jgi:hypothetical protein
LSMILRTTLEIQSKKYSIIWLKWTTIISMKRLLAVQYSFQFNKRLSLMRRGDFNDVAALDLSSRMPLMLIIRKHCTTGALKLDSIRLFRIILQILLQE